jgi:hypothetical protein
VTSERDTKGIQESVTEGYNVVSLGIQGYTKGYKSMVFPIGHEGVNDAKKGIQRDTKKVYWW